MSEVVRLLVTSGEFAQTGHDASWTPSIPQSIREVIGRRLGRLSGECNRILTIASIIGREFPISALERLTDSSEDALLDNLEEALSAKVIVELDGKNAGRFRFSHALVRETMYDELTGTRRVRLHRRIAEVLEGLYEADAEEHAAELAYHFFEAGNGERAVEYARLAGDRAIRLLAYEDAVVHYHRALAALALKQGAEPTLSCELQLRLGDALRKAGDIAAMRNSFTSAGELASQLHDAERLGRAALGLGSGEDDFIGRDDALLALLRRALAAAGEEDSSLKAMLEARLAPLLLDLGETEAGLDMSKRAVDTARRIGDTGTLVRALNSRHEALWDPDALEQRLEIANESVLAAADVDDKVAAWYAHDWRFTDLLELGELRDAEHEVMLLSSLAEDLRQPYWEALSKTTSVTLALAAGHFAEAEDVIAEVGAIGRRLRASSIEFYSDMQLFQLRREQGRLAEVDALMTRWMGDGQNLGRVARLAAVRHMELGQQDDARDCFERLAADNFAGVPRNNLWVDTLCNLADVCVYLGDRIRAEQITALLGQYADRCAVLGDVVWRGSVSRYLGMLATVCEQWDEADAYFDRAVEMNSRPGGRTALANVHYEAARSWLARDRAAARDAAQAHLDSALSTAQDLQMSALVRKALALQAAE